VATARTRPKNLGLPFTRFSIRKLSAYLHGSYGGHDPKQVPARQVPIRRERLRQRSPPGCSDGVSRSTGIRYLHGCYDLSNDKLWGVLRRRKRRRSRRRSAQDDPRRPDYPKHVVLARDLQAYLRWRNANARHPDVIAAQRKERARVRSERHQRWGRPHVPSRLSIPSETLLATASGARTGWVLGRSAADDWQLDAIGGVDHIPERGAEHPGHAPDALDDRDNPGSTQLQLLAAQTHPAPPGGLDVLQPIRLTPEVDSDHDPVRPTESTQRRMTHNP
jgi:hypothetical protein